MSEKPRQATRVEFEKRRARVLPAPGGRTQYLLVGLVLTVTCREQQAREDPARPETSGT
jgi:hypothetical protein